MASTPGLEAGPGRPDCFCSSLDGHSQKGRARSWLTYHVESDGLKQYAFPSDRFITGIPCCVSKICDTVMSLPGETAQEWVLGTF